MDTRGANSILLAAVLTWSAGGCELRQPDFSAYRSCADGCPPGCVCLAGKVCVPEKEPHDPRCCQAASCPECLSDADCPGSLCTCRRGVCLTMAGERDPELCGEPAPFCRIDADCQWGCTCVSGRCVPPAGEVDPGFCSHGYMSCTGEGECRVGCLCADSRCRPIDDSISSAYCAGKGQALMCRGPSYTVDDEDKLAAALEQAADGNHPYGIIFNPPTGEILLTKELPPITSLVYLDGSRNAGGPVTLRGAGAQVGLRVRGTAVVLKDLKLVGFVQAAVKIEGSARDVHLMRLRIGEKGAPNGQGVVVAPGASRVAVGRGRELGPHQCVGWVEAQPVEPCETENFDVNVIVSNKGDGISASGVTDLLIEGTWIGFDTVDDCDHLDSARPELANAGVGIRLENVQRAHLGLRHVGDLEVSGKYDRLPGCVNVGRNQSGGVLISGGGDILMRCLLIGNTPMMVPYSENRSFGLKISGNTGPIYYGTPAEARGFEAESVNLIHVETSPALLVNANLAPVWIRGGQLQSFGSAPQLYPAHLVEVTGARAAVDLVHLSLFGNVLTSVIRVGTDPGVRFSLRNSYLRSFGPQAPVVVSLARAQDVDLHHNLKVQFGSWCAGNCPNLYATDTLWEQDSAGDGWRPPGAVPEDPSCPVVDRGQAAGLDVNGRLDGLHSGCCPDLGAWECVTSACRAVESSCANTTCP